MKLRLWFPCANCGVKVGENGELNVRRLAWLWPDGATVGVSSLTRESAGRGKDGYQRKA